VSQIRPIGDRVVVKPAAKEEVTKSGIVIPDTAKEKPQEGTVIAVGSGLSLILVIVHRLKYVRVTVSCLRSTVVLSLNWMVKSTLCSKRMISWPFLVRLHK